MENPDVPALPADAIALFDLDHTLLEGDCGQLWVEYLADRGLAGTETLRSRLHAFYHDYRAGCFDILAYTRFQLAIIERLGELEARALREAWWQERLAPRLRPAARRVLEAHRRRGHRIGLATATHRFLVEPVAAALAVDVLIATETCTDPVTGEHHFLGLAAFAEGKLARARILCEVAGLELGASAFYSDSHHDLPLLAAVGHAYAVNPDERLAARARAASWGILDWRMTVEETR
jgi:HAD superfamily hydrolase (TIGR01490 family)